jgi:IrrE N-terminal-like domain
MALNEFTTVLRARKFLNKVNPATIPVPMEAYVKEVGGSIRLRTDLEPNEPGWAFASNGTQYICVNANDRPERQRFTICHELAHIVLGLPSDHKELPWWSYAKRPLAEILCDVFAAELLLPHHLFQPVAEAAQIGFAALDALAGQFLASTTATGSRFAVVISTPCAFVLSEQGKVRYASRSKPLQDANAWIPPRVDLPRGSLSARAREGVMSARGEIDADLWFSDWERGGVLLEETRHLAQWDQTLTLLWFGSEEVPPLKRYDRDREGGREPRENEEDELLEELDGHLRWPSKKRRR